jgi:hypothetical protein
MKKTPESPETSEALAKAVQYLGAVEVAPGRYAFPARTTTKALEGTTKREAWHVTDANGVIGIIVHAKALSEAGAVAMPAWWSPEKRFAWRTNWEGFSERTQALRFKSRGDAERYIEGGDVERITADLETGDEVQA